MSSLDRIINEYKELNRNPLSNCGITAGLVNDNDFRLWRLPILGPKDTAYRGLFFICAKFPEEYPITFYSL